MTDDLFDGEVFKRFRHAIFDPFIGLKVGLLESNLQALEVNTDLELEERIKLFCEKLEADYQPLLILEQYAHCYSMLKIHASNIAINRVLKEAK